VDRRARRPYRDEPQRAVQASTTPIIQYREEIECVLHKKAFKAYDA
jgi:hypothetical protein